MANKKEVSKKGTKKNKRKRKILIRKNTINYSNSMIL